VFIENVGDKKEVEEHLEAKRKRKKKKSTWMRRTRPL
jgi:hypothetical protein